MRQLWKVALGFLALPGLQGCSGKDSDKDNTGVLPPTGPPAACANGETYPPGAVEPMALGEVLSPYRWPAAIHRGTGARAPLDLAFVPCAQDPEIDWSPFEVLLFVSIPAW